MNLQSTKYEPRLMDHIFCSGNSKASKWIKWYNRHVLRLKGDAAEMSHVASIFTTSDNTPHVFESTTGNVDWSGIRGVQANLYHEWLYYYDGPVFAKRVTEKPISRDLCQKFIVDNLDRDYESGVPGAIEMALSGFYLPWLPGWARIKTKGDVWCGEIIAQQDQYFDILDDSIPANKFPPGLFWKHFEDCPTWKLK